MTIAMMKRLVPGVKVSVSYFPGQKGEIDSPVESFDSGSFFVRMSDGRLEEVAVDDLNILGGQSFVEQPQSTKQDIHPGATGMYGDQEVTVRKVKDNKVMVTPKGSMEQFSIRPEDLKLAKRRVALRVRYADLSKIPGATQTFKKVGALIDFKSWPPALLQMAGEKLMDNPTLVVRDNPENLCLDFTVQGEGPFGRQASKGRGGMKVQADLAEDMGEHLEGEGDPKHDDLDEFMDKTVQHEETGETGQVDEMLEDYLEEATGKPQEEMKNFYEEHELVEGSLQPRALAVEDLKEGDRVSNPKKGEGTVVHVGAPMGGFKGVSVLWDGPESILGPDPSMTPGKLTKINEISPRSPKDVQAYITSYATAFTQDQGYDVLIQKLVQAGFMEHVARDVISKEWAYLPETREMAQQMDGLQQFTDPLLAKAALDPKNSMVCPKCAITGHEGTCPMCGVSMKRKEIGPTSFGRREALKIKDTWNPDGGVGREIHMESGDGGIEFNTTDTGFNVKPMHDPGIENRIDQGGVGQSEETQMQTDVAEQEVEEQQGAMMMDEDMMPQVGDAVAVKGVNKAGGRVLAIKGDKAQVRFDGGAHGWFQRKAVIHAVGNIEGHEDCLDVAGPDGPAHICKTEDRGDSIVVSFLNADGGGEEVEVPMSEIQKMQGGVEAMVRESVTPPGMENVVKSVKEQNVKREKAGKQIYNPWAVAWAAYNKKGGKTSSLQRQASAIASPLKVVSADELSTIMASDDFTSVSDDYADPQKLRKDFASLVDRCQGAGISLREAVAQSRLMGINPKFIFSAVPPLKDQAAQIGLKVDALIG